MSEMSETKPVPEASATPDDTDAAATPAPGNPIDAIERQLLEARLVEVLRTVFDPEIPVNIYELGMIYDIAIEPPGEVKVKMTLTSPMCPVAGSLPGEVQEKLRGVAGVTGASVELVWEPPWTPEKMSESAKLELGFL